jgi:hypothetical protein
VRLQSPRSAPELQGKVDPVVQAPIGLGSPNLVQETFQLCLDIWHPAGLSGSQGLARPSIKRAIPVDRILSH